MTAIRPAATVQVIRELPQGGIEVLMLRRNRAVKFASGFWVFPGGKVEPHEMEGVNSLQAAKTAVVREAKEEADLDLQEADLHFFVHWTTPTSEPKRFGTYFFHTQVPYDGTVITVDNSEILEHRWMTPEAAMAAALAKKILLMPPTFISLQRIRYCMSYSEVVAEWQRSEPLYILPMIQMEGSQAISMYEGDAGYTSGDSHLEGPRHRLLFDYQKASFEFQYSDCDDHFPVNGLRHLQKKDLS